MIGDILLVSSNDIIARLIQYFTKGHYNHVAFMISDTELIEATYRGVLLSKLSKYNNNCDYKICSIKDISLSDRYTMYSFIHAQLGMNYDFIQIISIFFCLLLNIKRDFKPIEVKKAFICSELIAEAYDIVGVKFVSNVHKDLITPSDIEKSEFVR